MIDYHTHFLQRAHFGPDFAREWDARGGTGAWPDLTPEQFEAAMDHADRVIVFGITARALGIATPHEYVANLVKRNPAKYIGFMALDPSHPGALEEMERGKSDYGMRGIKLYPVMSLYNIADERFHPFFQKAVDLGLPVLTHMGASPARRGLLKYSLPLQIDELAVNFPELRVILAHLGHPWQREAALVIRKHPHIWADISGLWHRPWQGWEAMIVCQEWGVTDKLIYGSDYPLWEPKASIEALRKLNDQVAGTPLPKISAEVIDQILERNILSELGID